LCVCLFVGEGVPTLKTKSQITHNACMHIGFPCFVGTLHRHKDFYTVQTVYAFPLH